VNDANLEHNQNIEINNDGFQRALSKSGKKKKAHRGNYNTKSGVKNLITSS
jgi:hypothetical protein